MRAKPSTAWVPTPRDVVSPGSAWYARKMNPDASISVGVGGPEGTTTAGIPGPAGFLVFLGVGSCPKRSPWLVVPLMPVALTPLFVRVDPDMGPDQPVGWAVREEARRPARPASSRP